MKKEDDLEDLFKKEFENFEPEVNPSVWRNIQIGLKGVGIGVLFKMIVNKIGTSTIIAVTSSVVAVIGTVLVMHWTGSDVKNIQVANTKTVTPAVEKPAPVVNEPAPAINKEEEKSAMENSTISSKPNEAEVSKADKKEKESVINKYSEKRAASIYASPVSGTVPLIVNLVNNGTGKINKWTYGDTKTVETEVNPVHIFNDPGIYTVKLTSINADGKTMVDSVKIEVLGNSNLASSIPSDFSPNGDGNKDEFNFKLGPYISTQSVVIFDKKGNTMYEKEGGEDIIWNGKDKKGQNVKEGIYFYIYRAYGLDGKKYERQGSINLTR